MVGCPRLNLTLVRALGLSALLAQGMPSLAAERCSEPNADGVRSCEVSLEHASIAQMAVPQEQALWCWAASIAMIYAHYGYRITQGEIVAIRAPMAHEQSAGASGETITQLLSRAWVTRDNTTFESSAVAADRNANRFELTNEAALEELAQGRPLLVGANGHAMVLVALHFQRTAQGRVRIDGGTVIDPEPGTGVRRLTASEMTPTYIAAVRVRRADRRGAADLAAPIQVGMLP
jgi:hypothetical protein